MEDQVLDKLSQQLNDGNTAALEEAFRAYEAQLRRFIDFRMDRRLRSRLNDSDVFQEVFLAAQQRLKHFSKTHSLSPLGWLRQIAGQEIIDLERKHLGAECRRVTREMRPDQFDFANSTSASLAALFAGDVTSPSQAAIRSEQAEKIHSALSQMSEGDREVIALRHFEELSNDEVAEILQIKKAGASNRYVRAMARLAKLMKQEEPVDKGPGNESK